MVKKVTRRHKPPANFGASPTRLETSKSFRLQVGGDRLRIPTDSSVEIEMQTDADRKSGEIEIEIKWSRTKV